MDPHLGQGIKHGELSKETAQYPQKHRWKYVAFGVLIAIVLYFVIVTAAFFFLSLPDVRSWAMEGIIMSEILALICLLPVSILMGTIIAVKFYKQSQHDLAVNKYLPLLAVTVTLISILVVFRIVDMQKAAGRMRQEELLNYQRQNQAQSLSPTPANETANWKTYTNDKYKFEIKYPPHYVISRTTWTSVGKGIESEYATILFSDYTNMFGFQKPATLDNIKGGKILSINGLPAIEEPLSSNLEEGIGYGVIINDFPSKSKILSIGFSTKRKNLEDKVDEFKQILSTFKFLDSQGAPTGSVDNLITYTVPTGWKKTKDTLAGNEKIDLFSPDYVPSNYLGPEQGLQIRITKWQDKSITSTTDLLNNFKNTAGVTDVKETEFGGHKGITWYGTYEVTQRRFMVIKDGYVWDIAFLFPAKNPDATEQKYKAQLNLFIQSIKFK